MRSNRSVMRWFLRASCALAVLSASGSGFAQRICPPLPAPRVVEIREADPKIDKPHHDLMRRLLIDSVPVANTTVLLGPNVVLDFTDAKDDDIPLSFGPCVTLTSASAFNPGSFSQNLSLANGAANVSVAFARPPARTPHSPGPLLKFGPHRSDRERVFLAIECPADHPPNDNIRISGFRIYGPSFGQQEADDIGIRVSRCLNIEISNMEVAGWGGAAIEVLDDAGDPGPGQIPPSNRPGDRIGRPNQVKIFNNHIHHNQHPREGIFADHAAGYGVVVSNGAWAQISENLFDFNRHSIAANGHAGGYDALRNLVLKGGGEHFAGFHTHQFDIHGTGDNGFGGQAGVQFSYANNSFQYLAGPAIEIRGRPHLGVAIHDNVFAHPGLEHDQGADAIHLNDRNDRDVIALGPNNTVGFDPYGHYGVCDFDGDGIDDLFLATGRTWWFSSSGEFPWSYLGAHTERLNQVRLGYFDGDRRCDVLTELNGQWLVASGGTEAFKSIGTFGAPLSEVVFGRFDPSARDHRPGVTRQTTHAFRRAPNGDWLITPLSAPAWHPAQSSSFPLRDLRFGDFNGDGVTDVLAVNGGKWAFSASGNSPWEKLNATLSDPVSSLFIADLDNNNIDDLIKLETKVRSMPQGIEETFTWFVSDDGRSPWRKIKTYTFVHPVGAPGAFAFAGRFGAAPGGGVLLIDPARLGHFFSAAERTTGASPDWTSLFSF